MSIKKTLGGDRLGSGNKMQIAMHNYERSTHDLSYVWRSTMAPGTLVPFMKFLALNGDTFDIDMTHLIRTLPTVGPAFASFKLQADIFACPIRLYNAILHNNAVKLGMEMEKVLLPKVKIPYNGVSAMEAWNGGFEHGAINSSSLLAYLGYKHPGQKKSLGTEYREIQCLPILAYWDIFKNYYSNKQEPNAYVIGGNYKPTGFGDIETGNYETANLPWGPWTKNEQWGYVEQKPANGLITLDFTANPIKLKNQYGDESIKKPNARLRIYPKEPPYQENLTPELLYNNDNVEVTLKSTAGGGFSKFSLEEIFPLDTKPDGTNGSGIRINGGLGQPATVIELTAGINTSNPTLMNFVDSNGEISIKSITLPSGILKFENNMELIDFPLDNLDKARGIILKNFGLEQRVYITMSQESGNNKINFLPYSQLCETNPDTAQPQNAVAMNGLAVKTYQSDIFNNWLNSDWISGENGIGAITKVDTSNGLELDALNLAQKVYNMLNRIAVSGGTYEDWQEAVYGSEAMRRAESPIYCGGMSAEIVFDEVVGTADTDTAASGNNPLGKLAGRGRSTNQKSGHVTVKINEPSYIIGIVSITPRIDYSQGNDWDMMELDNMDDLHKPALDGIGFQDLLTYNMHGAEVFGTDSQKAVRAAGKIPAWLHYMTNYNRVFGGFAEENKEMFMILGRRYELEKDSDGYYKIKDLTTYIDPQKFNYAFADVSLEAQNFWVQLGCNVTARRKMSAKQIPNL